MATRTNKTLTNFRSKLIGGGARPNLFEVAIPTFPPGITGWDAANFQFMCKAAQLPGQTIGAIEVPFRGRTFKVAGDRTIDPWTVTIINDEDFKYRTAFEKWTERIAKLDTNIGATSPAAYMQIADVYQLGRGGKASSTDNTGNNNAVLKHYKFDGIFPTSVSPIDLSYDSSNAIEEFTVEFQVQSIIIVPPGGANA